ncbi:RelA/SpoT family protein [Thiomicrorhabdus heinhorstiae]|uniref:GTP pyrophosphokinase n=1 Tax=Thiomicrorhabdus heinhorstiae TaxID=2748010 RepID=A0ABS0BSP5_9GAMM|nr:bifunctional (p)ppGpp synthetase/guanosine-3',5'-bis(diphosphate) 3'-pyrophosphohydrolase [Thiomicrorhabdus heinhorstiae]MBF6056877.1 bifunctional (p)ppGpp synthetase/guanosine-3',5'-bis(diphosphate) 3'-pyrophosphohydrolase [Thiomicrorhabdus heinhorstiae]
MTSQELYKQLFGKNEHTPTEIERYSKACELALEAFNLPAKSIVRSIDVADILAKLNIDEETLVATLLSDGNLEDNYSDDYIRSSFGTSTAELVHGIRKLNQFKEFDVERKSDAVQNERLRQMLLAMTSDIRIMIVKLAYRVARLRHLKYEDEEIRHQIAAETELIFSPLANRLGIAQLKWELEDLSFRFLYPQKYKEIASLLQSKRAERELYIQDMIKQLEDLLAQENIKAKISGRPKHIYSIWKKMQRKNLTIDELFDLRAVRIYVDSVTTCYEALGLIHSKWNYVKQEFDDYIATPKENGYQSIHTVVIGPEGKTVEIQIRTHEMHHNAEYGIAAHWRYKEGGKSYDSNLERSIANVRQLLENSDDPDVFKEISTELQSQNIFVMTPTNQIITLRQGSTPLDFAYNIHTELGHRCRGAKVNGRIQPLSYVLKTGDKVEILAVKNGQPSRNWLNPNLGYLTSSSARNKVRGWFNKQNRGENIEAGEALYHREIKRLHAEEIDVQDVVARFKLENSEILFEDLGKGRINDRQLNNAIQSLLKPEKHTAVQTQRSINFREAAAGASEKHARAYVVGASNLSTNLAPCCTPHPGDDIVGYVTRGRGITVHKRECANILNLNHNEQQRLIQVVWDKELAENPLYSAELHILAFDRKGLLRDVMSVLTDMDINLIASQTETDQQERSVTMKLTIELSAGMNLGDLLDRIEIVQNVESASIKTL